MNFKSYFSFCLLIVFVLSCLQEGTNSAIAVAEGEGRILRFSLSPFEDSVQVNDSLASVSVYLSDTIKVDSLVPQIEFSGLALSPSLLSPQDFKDTVIYRIIGNNYKATNYKIISHFLNSAKRISEFNIIELNHTLSSEDLKDTLKIALSDTLKNKTLTYHLEFEGQNIDTLGNDANTLSEGLSFKIYAEDKSSKTIPLKIRWLSHQKFISKLDFSNTSAEVKIDTLSHRIDIQFPSSADLKNLQPQWDFTGEKIEFKTVSPNFSDSVYVVVTAEDQSQIEYLIISQQFEKFHSEAPLLFLGNSITKHPPAPEIGWDANFGMAASSEKNDYVHVFIDSILSRTGNDSLNTYIQNIGAWELDFNYPLSSFSASQGLNPKLIVLRIGENVSDSAELLVNYPSQLKRLIDSFAGDSTQIFITGNFWSSSLKDSLQQLAAQQNQWTYIDLSEVSKDSSNYALKDFENYFISIHPSDKGMKAIADALFAEFIKIWD